MKNTIIQCKCRGLRAYYDEIVEQLPTPYLLLGDFNGHNVIFGSDAVNERGRHYDNTTMQCDLK